MDIKGIKPTTGDHESNFKKVGAIQSEPHLRLISRATNTSLKLGLLIVQPITKRERIFSKFALRKQKNIKKEVN